MQKIRVLIVDDHAIVRAGIRALLALAEDIEVVGEAGDGREALEMAKQAAPDVVLMDVAMPVMGGLEATRRIRRECGVAKVLVLTQYDDKDSVLPLIEAGASAFISKTAAAPELVAGIRAIYRGDSFLSPSASKVVIEGYRRYAKMMRADDPYEQLTDREREVLKLVAEGYTSQEIADMLVLSLKTIEGHRTSIISKLGVRSSIELAKYALRKGIITL